MLLVETNMQDMPASKTALTSTISSELWQDQKSQIEPAPTHLKHVYSDHCLHCFGSCMPVPWVCSCVRSGEPMETERHGRGKVWARSNSCLFTRQRCWNMTVVSRQLSVTMITATPTPCLPFFSFFLFSLIPFLFSSFHFITTEGKKMEHFLYRRWKELLECK